MLSDNQHSDRKTSHNTILTQTSVQKNMYRLFQSWAPAPISTRNHKYSQIKYSHVSTFNIQAACKQFLIHNKIHTRSHRWGEARRNKNILIHSIQLQRKSVEI